MFSENFKNTTGLNHVDVSTGGILKVIYERRSVRKYKNRPVDRAVIGRIIDAGRMAPSAMNKQPWRFHVITDKEDISAFSKEISKGVIKGIANAGLKGIVKTVWDFLHFSHKTDFLKEEDPVFHGAPAVVIVSAPKDNEWALLDVGMCCQNMMLVAKHMGLDTCPVGMVKYGSDSEIFKKLDLQKSEQVVIALVLGYGDENPEPKERRTDNIRYL